MKVKDLIEELSTQDPEATVVLICDHGQTLMEVSGGGSGYVESLDDRYLEETEDVSDSPVYVLEAY